MVLIHFSILQRTELHICMSSRVKHSCLPISLCKLCFCQTSDAWCLCSSGTQMHQIRIKYLFSLLSVRNAWMAHLWVIQFHPRCVICDDSILITASIHQRWKMHIQLYCLYPKEMSTQTPSSLYTMVMAVHATNYPFTYTHDQFYPFNPYLLSKALPFRSSQVITSTSVW
jgi:hypothetical protein